MAAAIAAWAAAAADPGRAQTTSRAGTPIVNVAQAQAGVGDAAIAATSNAATFLVAERLDVTLTSPHDKEAPIAAGGGALPALLVNAGNGDETFALAAIGTTGVAVRGIAIDVDGDGAYDPARDTLLTGDVTPVIAPGATLALIVLADGGTGDAVVSLTARATTGSGTPGTLYAGAGDGGSDAVVGSTGAVARVDLPFGRATTAPTLVKSQAVRAPDGDDRPVRGAIVTYTLLASFADARRAVRIEDPMPTGARYVAGSLTLDGAALTDAADDDAGGFDGVAVAVSLGDVAGPATRTIRFQAILQ